MNKIVRTMFVFALLLAAVGPLGGCAGVATTKEENRRIFNRVVSYDTKMWADDWALAAQINRPLRTSRWIID